MTVDFDSGLDRIQIRKICDAFEAAGGNYWEHGRLSFEMDLAACNPANDNPEIDFQKLMAFKSVDLLHDCYGIMQHMDRETGKIMNEFRPRSAVPAPASGDLAALTGEDHA